MGRRGRVRRNIHMADHGASDGRFCSIPDGSRHWAEPRGAYRGCAIEEVYKVGTFGWVLVRQNMSFLSPA